MTRPNPWTTLQGHLRDYATTLGLARQMGQVQQSQQHNHQRCLSLGFCAPGDGQQSEYLRRTTKTELLGHYDSLAQNLTPFRRQETNRKWQSRLAHARVAFKVLVDLLWDLHCCNGTSVPSSTTRLDLDTAILKYYNSLPAAHALQNHGFASFNNTTC